MDIGKWDTTFMKIATDMAQMSHCAAKKVCCVLVKDGQIISSGINGTPKNFVNCDDLFKKLAGVWHILDTHVDKELWVECESQDMHNKWSKKYEIHAEQNAIAKAASKGISTEGATAYVTYSPCTPCTKLLIAAGIKRVVIGTIYDDDPEAFELLNNCQIETILL